MLAVGRALMSRARLLLLDEPSMGMSPRLVQELFAIIQDINRTDTTILLVEQNAHQALRIASRAYVLETGRITLAGTGQELLGEAGTRAYVESTPEGILIKPVTKFIRSLRGSHKGKGVLQAMMADRQAERKL